MARLFRIPLSQVEFYFEIVTFGRSRPDSKLQHFVHIPKEALREIKPLIYNTARETPVPEDAATFAGECMTDQQWSQIEAIFRIQPVPWIPTIPQSQLTREAIDVLVWRVRHNTSWRCTPIVPSQLRKIQKLVKSWSLDGFLHTVQTGLMTVLDLPEPQLLWILFGSAHPRPQEFIRAAIKDVLKHSIGSGNSANNVQHNNF